MEDNEMNRDMLSRRLERRGFRVILAMDEGDRGRTAGANVPISMLMDLLLPGIDGGKQRAD
ncbi:MAG: hypothetical protein R3F31_05245 [Verrucomicrobiales bacterium]